MPNIARPAHTPLSDSRAKKKELSARRSHGNSLITARFHGHYGVHGEGPHEVRRRSLAKCPICNGTTSRVWRAMLADSRACIALDLARSRSAKFWEDGRMGRWEQRSKQLPWRAPKIQVVWEKRGG